jgi:hypothetical protein
MCRCAGSITQCESAGERVKVLSGSLRIDSFYFDWRNHADAFVDKNGNKVLLYDDFPVQYKIGDSLVKRKGEDTYALYTEDSVYVQRFDCVTRRGIVLSRSLR